MVPRVSSKELAGRVSIITGASRGIGAATARRLAQDGSIVVLASRSASDLAAVAASITDAGGVSIVVPTDVSDCRALDALMQRAKAEFGRLDVLVNNAGVLPAAARAEHTELQAWEAQLRLNLTAPWYLACRFKEAMNPGAAGCVVNITSSAAFYPSVGLSGYNASKAGLNMLTRTLALEWARDRVRVIGVAPGKVDTDLVKPVLDYSERKGVRINPLEAVAAPVEVADLIAYLVSDRARFITGSVITIDGGEVAATGSDLAR